MSSAASAFMFATGIENSSPTVDQGRTRIDELEVCGHYRHWQKDFGLVEQLGIKFLRYGPALYKTWLGPDRYDWEFCDSAFADLYRRKIVPIADLCHFGVPDWIGGFQNPDFPRFFHRYCFAFAERYPWVQLYTPINEMLICAQFSAEFGFWNEQLKSSQAFVRALKHIVRANVLAMHAILRARPDAIFIQSESTEYFHASDPQSIKAAELRNARRFLSLDLNYGRRVSSEVYEYLLDNGMTREEYHFFLQHDLKHYCIMGNDYYWTNEHRVYRDDRVEGSGEVLGYNEITRQYYARYLLPVMHTETNYREGEKGDEAVYWLWKEWANVLRVRNDGVPIVGFTWYSLTDQMDWSIALRAKEGNIDKVGLFDLDRQIRPVGIAYRDLIRDWREVLPTQSVCLRVPVLPVEDWNEAYAQRLRRAALEHRRRAPDEITNA